MKNKKSKILSVVTSVGFLALPFIVNAQITNPLKFDKIPELFQSLLNYGMGIVGAGAVLAFIYSGFLFVKAQGNEEDLKTAKTVFKNICIGTAILLGGQLIASIIVSTIQTLR